MTGKEDLQDNTADTDGKSCASWHQPSQQRYQDHPPAFAGSREGRHVCLRPHSWYVDRARLAARFLPQPPGRWSPNHGREARGVRVGSSELAGPGMFGWSWGLGSPGGGSKGQGSG